ncbi:MAG TPA: glycosyl hydrolase family 28-related protein, partial [Candidatus Saccharimonadales bacterium]|nr:glycosyl hydrolase family 28-related protein [Candidatus Saccharimonadales bacterium]
MATRLPTPGSDDGAWGTLLNDFLSVEHNADGSLKKAADIAAKYTKPGTGIPTADIADGAVTTAKLDATLQSQLGSPFIMASGAGIDPTGAADSTTALQAKIAEALSTGRPLYIGPGVYRITSTLDMRGAGLVVRGAGPVKTTIRQHTSNIVAVRFGGHAQTLEEFSVDFNTNQPAANTNATAFECYNTFFSTYRKLFAFRCARGFQLGTNSSIISAQGGMNGAFSCHFDTLEINGYSISAIDFTSTNGYST